MLRIINQLVVREVFTQEASIVLEVILSLSGSSNKGLKEELNRFFKYWLRVLGAEAFTALILEAETETAQESDMLLF